MLNFRSKMLKTPYHEKNVPIEWKNTPNGHKKSTKIQSSICTQWKIKKITYYIHAKSSEWTLNTNYSESAVVNWQKLNWKSKTRVNFCADSVVICCKSGSALYHHNKLSLSLSLSLKSLSTPYNLWLRIIISGSTTTNFWATSKLFRALKFSMQGLWNPIREILKKHSGYLVT